MPRIVGSYTILDPVVSDLSHVRIDPISVSGASELQVTGYYTLRTNSADPLTPKPSGSASFVLSPSQKTALVNFLTTNLIPVIIAEANL